MIAAPSIPEANSRRPRALTLHLSTKVATPRPRGCRLLELELPQSPSSRWSPGWKGTCSQLSKPPLRSGTEAALFALCWGVAAPTQLSATCTRTEGPHCAP